MLTLAWYDCSVASESLLPQSGRPVQTAAGHWVLARAGKKVLRPGGLELTRFLLSNARLSGADVVEFAPGLGRTAALINQESIHSYTGVDADATAVQRVQTVVGPTGKVINATAQNTGLPDNSADVIIGEAMLTMQGEKTKAQIAAEATRILRPGGRYAIHELALVPDDIDQGVADTLRKRLSQVIHVNARPLTEKEWRELLENSGYEVLQVKKAPMALLSPGRNLKDEGLGGVVRILRNVMRDKDLRARVLEMRRLFNEYRDHLAGIAIVAQVKEGNPND